MMRDLDPNTFNQASLEVQTMMGRISASITHEIKNHLAIINEQSGLLGDLAVMAQSSGTLNPKRVAGLSERISQRVAQSNDIVRRYNAFAHLGDQPLAPLQAGELLCLMLQLYQRLAKVKSVELCLDEGSQDFGMTNRPLFLAGAIFYCLDAAVNAAAPGGEVKVQVVDLNHEAQFRFAWSGEENSITCGPSPALLLVLNAHLQDLPDVPELVLCMPRILQDAAEGYKG